MVKKGAKIAIFLAISFFSIALCEQTAKANNKKKNESGFNKNYLSISGYLDLPGQSKFTLNDKPFALDYPLYDRPNGKGPYRIEVFDQKNQKIKHYDFSTEKMHVSTLEGGHYIESGILAVSIPFSSKAQKIVIKKGKEVLYQQLRTLHRPKVRIITPESGSTINEVVDIEWVGDDPDPGQLLYRLELRSDSGGSWEPHSCAITSAEKASLAAKYLGPPGKAVLRVICSDGFNFSIDKIEVFIIKK